MCSIPQLTPKSIFRLSSAYLTRRLKCKMFIYTTCAFANIYPENNTQLYRLKGYRTYLRKIVSLIMLRIRNVSNWTKPWWDGIRLNLISLSYSSLSVYPFRTKLAKCVWSYVMILHQLRYTIKQIGVLFCDSQSNYLLIH